MTDSPETSRPRFAVMLELADETIVSVRDDPAGVRISVASRPHEAPTVLYLTNTMEAACLFGAIEGAFTMSSGREIVVSTRGTRT